VQYPRTILLRQPPTENTQAWKTTMAKMAVAAALTDGFMGNQGHLPNRYQSESLNVYYVCKISRTELVSARSNRPLSNSDENHNIRLRTILVQSYGDEQQKHTTVKITMAKMAVAAALTDCSVGNQGHLPNRYQSESLNVYYVYKISRTELVSARSNTAIVKYGRNVSFSDSCSGWEID
jgi:hypothetical protein